MAFTPGDDINILQATDTLNVGAGKGNDKYILAPNQLTPGQTVNITDTAGANVLQLIGGLTIASSKIAANAVQLTLSNGAIVNVFGADSFSYEIGGNPLLSQPGVVRSFHDFATVSLGGSVPVSGLANGATNVEIHSDGSTSANSTAMTDLPGAITLVSTSATGVQGNSDSMNPVFSPDGSKIAFGSNASNLVPGDTNGQWDIFIKDLQIGAITRVSTNAVGTQGNLNSFLPAFSPDGNKIAFYSMADNLVPGDTNGGGDAFVKDLQTGAITRVFSDEMGSIFSFSAPPEFSPNGGKIAFGDTYAIFIKDLQTGIITRASTNATGEQGLGHSENPAFSPDGNRVAFSSDTSTLVPIDTNGASDIFIKDLQTGAITLVSTDATGEQGNSDSFKPVFSPDGSKIVFSSAASNLVQGDTNGQWDIFIKDLQTGAITLISTDATGEQGNSDSFKPVFSPDGSRIAFLSNASNLVPGDTNEQWDIFIKDLQTGAITLVSTDTAGIQGNLESFDPVFSPDGSRIAFQSYASNLVPGDTNQYPDIFVKDLSYLWF